MIIMQRYLLTNTGANHDNKSAMVRRATNKGGRYYALNNSGEPNTRKQNAMRAIIRNGIEPTINKKSTLNASNTTRKAGMKNINGLHPYVYPCPIADGLMPHQEAAAILSTRLGNPDKASNPTKREDGYIPMSELLFHSAGSGKTLTMWRIYFWWCIRWWAERPKYTLPVGINTPISAMANRNSETPKALPCIVIFISQSQEVDNMGTNELVQFEKILGMQATRASSSKYKELVMNNFINALPDQKVVALFKRSKEDDISKPPRWRRAEPKDSHIQYNYNNSTQYYASSGKEDRHPMLTGAFPMLAACMGYAQPKIDLGVTVTLPGGFKGQQGVPMFNLYMQMKAYVYMCTNSYSETNVVNNISRGAYYEFLRLFIIQNYAKALESNFGAPGKSETTKQAIAQEAGREVEYYTLPWDAKDEVSLSDVKVGDFVRFQVMRKDKGVKDLTTRFDSDEHKRAGWAEDEKMYETHFTQFCDRNRGGVSPLFYVKKIKKKDGNYQIGLQRVLIHDITTENHVCYPLQDGRLKSNFRLYDIYRFNRPITSFNELRLDNATMSETQQTCSANGLMTILKHAGAELKAGIKDDWAPTRVEMAKDKENKMLMWWLACGKGILPSHPAFTPGGKFQGGSVLANHWEWLGMKTGRSKTYSATPRMPATLMLGMSAELAVSVFKRLPAKSLIMVDEVQKYSGEQGSDVTKINNPFKKEQVDVKKGMKCLLASAMSSSENNGRSGSQSSSSNNTACGDFSSTPGNCVGVFASATPFVVDLSDKKNKVNELEELVRMIGTSKKISIPPFLPAMANKPKEALNKYRKSVETLLGQSNLLVSFIDLDRDPLVIPTLTKRGISKSGRGSLVDVWNVRNIKSRLSKRDGGTALTAEKRIGVLGEDQVPVRAAKPTGKAAVATKKKYAKGSKSRPTPMNISANPQMNFIRAMGY